VGWSKSVFQMRQSLLAGLVAGLMAQVVAARSGYACNTDADCKGDRVCEAGKCVSPSVGAGPMAGPMRCQQDKDCQGNDVCENDVCVGAGGSAAAAPAMTPAQTPAPAPTSAEAAPPAPPPSGAAPAPGTPATPPTAKAAATPAGAPGAASGAPGPKDGYKSLVLMLPNVDNFFGLAAQIDARLESMSSLLWTVMAGCSYEGLFYTKSSNTYTQALGLTMGLRPALQMLLSFDVRAGAVLTLAHAEVAGRTSNHFDGALLVGGDLLIGYLVLGVEGWMHNGSMWMLRGGASW